MGNSDINFMDYLFEKSRISTFTNWAYDDKSSCSPRNMARTGFIQIGDSEDSAICVFCCKELEGFEKDDDPLKEHTAHSKDCPFLGMKSFDSMTVQEGITALEKIHESSINRVFDTTLNHLRSYLENISSIKENLDRKQQNVSETSDLSVSSNASKKSRRKK